LGLFHCLLGADKQLAIDQGKKTEEGKSDDEDLQEIIIRADRLKIPISVHHKVANVKPQPIAWDYHDLVNSCFLIHMTHTFLGRLESCLRVYEYDQSSNLLLIHEKHYCRN
jgi:hypothetical protein